MSSPLRNAALLIVSVSLTSACSLIANSTSVQCGSDSDCGFLGSGYTCDEGVCVAGASNDDTTGTSTGTGATGTTLSPTTTPVTTATTATTMSTSAESTDDGGSSGSTGVAGPCPNVTKYSQSSSIVVVRNACDLPSLVGTVFDGGENELEAPSPLSPVPFDICLYGELGEELWIGDNGYVAIGDSPPEALQADVGAPHSLGEPGVPGPGVLPFWDTLQPATSGACVAVEGSEPNRTIWITWDGACFEDGSGVCDGASSSSLTFSVGFEEGTGAVIIGYISMSGTGGFDERAEGQTAVTGITAAGPRGCVASDCDDMGSCSGGEPCNYTEVGALTIRPLETVIFEPVL